MLLKVTESERHLKSNSLFWLTLTFTTYVYMKGDRKFNLAVCWIFRN